jgi:hypothetical protein
MIRQQTLANAPAIDARFTRAQISDATQKQLGLNLPAGASAASTPAGKFGTVLFPKERFNDANYPIEQINRIFAHELGNILSYKLSKSGYTYGDPNGIGAGFKDKDTGAKLEKCIFGNVTF